MADIKSETMAASTEAGPSHSTTDNTTPLPPPPLPPAPPEPASTSQTPSDSQVKMETEPSASETNELSSGKSAVTDVEMNGESSSPKMKGRKRKAPSTDPSSGPSKPKVAAYFCAICQCRLNSAVQAQNHFSGKSHRKMLRNQEKLATGEGITGSEKVIVPAMPQTGATSAKSGSSSETLYWEFNNEDTSNPMATAVPVTFGSTSNSKTSFALSCTVCGVEFNSASQADAHYSGKKHKNAVAKSEELSSSTTTPTKSGPSTAIYQPYYWQFSGQGAFKDQYDENVYEDKPKDTDLICNVCQLSFNSPSQAEMHFNGKKHAAAVANKAITEGKASAINADSARQGGGKKGLTKFTCAVCDFSLNSQWQLNQHMNGIRHKLKAGIISEPPAWWSAQQEAVKNTKPGSGKGVYQFFKCEACDVTLNSQKQLEAHLTSQKHKQVAEGGGPPQRGRGRGRGMGRGADRRQRGGFQGGRGFNQRGGFRGRGASSRGGDGGRGSFQRGGIRGRGLNQRGGFGGRGGYQGRGGGVGSFQSGGGQYQDGGNSRGNSGRGNQRGARGGRGRGRGRGKAPKGPNPNKIPLYASFIPPKQFPKVQHGYGQGYYDG